MKIKIFTSIFLLLVAINTFAQYGTMASNNIQVPQLTNNQLIAMPSPQKGMLAYNMTTNCLSYYDGGQWKCSDLAKSVTGLKATITQPITSSNIQNCYGVTTDANDFTYIVGSYSGTSITICDTVMTSAGSMNMYVAKLNQKGCLVWAKSFGTTSWNEAFDIITDATGNVYVTGHFSGTINFGGTGNSLTAAGGSDVFVAKFNSAGETQWARKGGSSSSSYEYGYGIALDASQNVYIAGSFVSSATFATTTLTSAGDEDIVVAKYNANGDFQWAYGSGGAQKDFARDIAINASNDIFVGGTFNSSFNYGGTTIAPSNVGVSDAFIAKYNTNGVIGWVKRGGGNYHDFGNAVAVDGSGNAYLAGGFADNATFGGLSASASSSYLDAFVVKFNNAGIAQWVSKVGTGNDDEVKGIFADASGNCYVTGYYKSTPFFGETPAKSFGGKDYFVAKFDNTGAFQWVKNGGGRDDDLGASITKNGSKITVFGVIVGTGFFDKSIVSAAGGYQKVFLQKIEE